MPDILKFKKELFVLSKFFASFALITLTIVLCGCGCAHDKFHHQINIPKATVEQCLGELEHRLSIEGHRASRERTWARKSVDYGDMKITEVEINIENKPEATGTNKSLDELQQKISSEEVKMKLIGCYDKHIGEGARTVRYTLTKNDNQLHGFKNMLDVCNIVVLDEAIGDEVAFPVTFTVRFSRKVDIAQSFEVALDRGHEYKDIASCLALYVKDKKDLSRMISPAVKYGEYLEMLLEDNVDLTTKYPCISIYGNDELCLPIFQVFSNGDKKINFDLVRLLISHGANINSINAHGDTFLSALRRHKVDIDLEHEHMLEQYEKYTADYNSTSVAIVKAGGKPSKLYFNNSGFSAYKDIRNSNILFLMNEEVLYEQNNRSDIIRFFWRPSWEKPFVVKIYKDENQKYILIYKVLEKENLAALKEQYKEKRRELTPEEWNNLANKMKAIDFMNLPLDDVRFGLDGADWIIETIKDNKYHVVQRWSPKETDPFREFALYLLKLTGEQVHLY